MSSHVFHEIFLHLNWHTKESRPLLVPDLEAKVHAYLRSRIQKMKGVFLHEIDGTETHLHLAIQIEPSVTISTMVGELKGATSHEINQLHPGKVLEWQRGFGVVSFGKRQLPWVLDYIRRQKEHHARGTVAERLEKVTMDDNGLPWAEMRDEGLKAEPKPG